METVTAIEEFFEKNYIGDYHVYKEVGEAVVESRWFAKEPKNASNRHAVAVKKELS